MKNADVNEKHVLSHVITRGFIKIRFNSGIYRSSSSIANLEPLDEDALVDILTEPKNALVKQYQKIIGA